MEKVKMQYLGTVPTRVLTERNGVKVDVEPGDVVEMNRDVADTIAKGYKNVWVREGSSPTELKPSDAKKADAPEGDNKDPEKTDDDAGQVEGGLDDSKVQKAVPTKKK